MGEGRREPNMSHPDKEYNMTADKRAVAAAARIACVLNAGLIFSPRSCCHDMFRNKPRMRSSSIPLNMDGQKSCAAMRCVRVVADAGLFVSVSAYSAAAAKRAGQ